MRVGLIDGDLKPDLMSGFNLELMKIAALLRKQNHYYELIITNDKLHQSFSKLYYRADLRLDVPEKIIKTRIADVDGMSFRKTGYFTYSDELEKLKPETDIYRNFIEEKTRTQIARVRGNNLLNGIHLRISRDGKTLQDLPIYNTSLPAAMSYVYDKNIFQVEGWQDAIKELSNIKGNSYITFKMPQIMRNYRDFFDFNNSPLSQQKTEGFYIDAHMPKEDFEALIKEKYPAKFKFYCFEDSDIWTESKKRVECMKIFQRILICQSLGCNFSLKYRGCSSPDGLDILINYLVIWNNLLNKGEIDCDFGHFVTTPHEKRTLFRLNARDIRDKVFYKYFEFQRYFFINPLELRRKGEVFKP